MRQTPASRAAAAAAAAMLPAALMPGGMQRSQGWLETLDGSQCPGVPAFRGAQSSRAIWRLPMKGEEYIVKERRWVHEAAPAAVNPSQRRRAQEQTNLLEALHWLALSRLPLPWILAPRMDLPAGL